jgi:hypothetical protein
MVLHKSITARYGGKNRAYLKLDSLAGRNVFIMAQYEARSGPLWFYVLPLRPAKILAGKSWNLHARRLCCNFCSAVKL